MKSITSVFEDLVEKDKENEIEEGRFVKKVGRTVGRGLKSVGSFLKSTITSHSHLD